MSEKITAIMPCRNSAWCIGATARALLAWVDTLIVLNHASTDETGPMLAAIADEYEPGRLAIIEEPAPAWEEMNHRHRLLEAARASGATRIVTVDDDEILTSNLLPRIREMVLACPPGHIMQLPWIQLRGSLDSFITGGQWASQDVSIAFVDEPVLGWWARKGYHHHHRHPMGKQLVPYQPLGPAFLGSAQGGLMHMQMVSDRRLRAKQALYVMQETVRWPGRMTAAQLNAMYGPTVYSGGYAVDVTTHSSGTKFIPANPRLGQTPPEWLDFYNLIVPFIREDAEPWQEGECKRLVDLHGIETFAGLDLFGVEKTF